ncbi:uncharacterized protein LOC113531215 isoform X2 [Pangasianodon hypophthalmus]|uniref:uncharacterized protein LOC113531215 isoform X2 n=1 Tax=Pangasianodon hypophthalmus TaxID=310915 RepID=UPI002307ACAC|nr:uncharacterized protein LOC113531215 isoform X2 [Pangasianodon hypophthalmus]
MMYLKGLIISQFLVVLVVKNSSALSCVPCYLLSGCPELKCPGGKVIGLCGCCYVCAKQLDERCGGLYGLIGTCDQGLQCVLPPQEVNETVTIIHHVGVCQAKTTPGPEATIRPANGHTTPSTPMAGILTTRGEDFTEHKTPDHQEAKTTARNEETTRPANPTLRNNTSPAQQANGHTTPSTPMAGILTTRGEDFTEHKTPDHQEAKTTARNEETTRPANPTLRNNTSPAQQGDVLKTGTTLRQNTSIVQQVSPGPSNMNTSPDSKLQNGVSAFLRTKGVDVLCLIMSLCVLSLLK